MSLFGRRRNNVPSQPIPVDVRELGPINSLHREPGMGEPLPSTVALEHQGLAELMENRPRGGLFGGARRWLSTPNEGGVTGADRLMMVGMALRSANDPLFADALIGYRGDLRKRGEEMQRRQLQAGLADHFGRAYGQPPQPGADPLQGLMPDLMRAQAAGVDVSGYLRAAEALEARNRRNAYLNTVPQNLRPEADLDPTSFASYAREQRTPSFHAVAPGTSIVGIDRGTGEARPVFSSPRASEPLTTDQLTASVIQKALRGGELNPQEQAVMNRHLFGTDNSSDRPSPNSVVGRILDKFTRGEQLSAQEEEIRGRYMTGTLSMTDQLVQQMLPGLAPGAAPMVPGAPAAPPQRPPARSAAQGRPGSSRENPVRPKSRAEAEALPPGTWIADPKGNVFPKR